MIYILLFVFNCVFSMPIRETTIDLSTTTLTSTMTSTMTSTITSTMTSTMTSTITLNNLLESKNNNVSQSNSNAIISSCVAIFCIALFFFLVVFCKCRDGQKSYLDTVLLKQTCCCK